MKILVFGSRTVSQVNYVESVLNDIHEIEGPITAVVTGGAKGADTIARDWVFQRGGIDWYEVRAQWDQYGRAAGPIRNQQMLDENPDIELAVGFADKELDETKGTKNMMGLAKKAGIETRFYRSDLQGREW